MFYRSLMFLGMLSLTAAAAADPTASGTDAGKAATGSAADTAAIDNRNCLKDTGSMIRRKDGCTANGADGESYDEDDIRRTGANTVGGALRDLVPGATVGR